jgi:choline dehydrogenase-like flavoprotein
VSELRDFDAIVVGSGMSGGWAAKELTELGLRTLVLDAGGPFSPDRDTVEHVPLWELPFRGLNDRRAIETRQPVQRRSVSFDELSRRFWTDDVDNPYTVPADKPFDWFRSRVVGGKSNIWGRQVYRLSDLDFEANARDGIGVDWPIRYVDIAPWYDRVERFIGVSGERLGLGHLPDGPYLPPMAMTCAELHVRARMRAQFGGERLLTIGRTATLTAAHNGRAACHYCGPCHRGCVTRSYFSSPNATLPAAAATGRMTLRTYGIVHSLVYDERIGRVSGVRAIDARTRAPLEYTARVVFLCASALESARILLNSRSSAFPDGLANGSGQVGRNIMDSIKWGGAAGTFDGWTDRHTIGDRPNGILVPRFRNVTSKRPDFIRGYHFQGGASRRDWRDRTAERGIGVTLKRRLVEPGPWVMSLGGFGECLPNEANRAVLHPTQVDAWGIPTLHIDCAWSDNELALHKDMTATAVEILEAAGAAHVRPSTRVSVPGNANHEMGTARMGRDRKTSVLNAHCQAHEVANLFVTDGACMTSCPCQNPSLTYMALTARAAHHAVAEMRRRNI